MSPNLQSAILITAILLLGLFSILHIAEGAIARQDIICQEGC